MPFRLREVAFTLAFVLALLAAKHIPVFAGLPLSEAIGIVCFSFAIYLGLRLLRAELDAGV